jgi:hypothetical protein
LSIIHSHPTRAPNKKFNGQYYLSGTVLLLWLVEADKAGGSALKVGLLLWHLKGIKKTTENLVVTRKVAWDRLRIGRSALARGLSRLEAANLITTIRGRGKAIRVTILSLRPTEAQPCAPQLCPLTATFLAPSDHVSAMCGVNSENAEDLNV